MHTLFDDKDAMNYLANHHTIDNKDIEHKVINFIDDSNWTLILEDPNSINEYITAYMYLMSVYYNLNMLKIN